MIINAPANVSFTGSSSGAPPRISFLLIGMQKSESINPADSKKTPHPLTFLRQKTWAFRVFIRSRQINRLMCDIKVSTHHNRFASLCELFGKLTKAFTKSDFVLNSRALLLWIRKVNRQKNCVRKFGTDDSLPHQILRDPFHKKHFLELACQNSHTTVALLWSRWVPIRMISRWAQESLLGFGQFCANFLKSNHVKRILYQSRKPFLKQARIPLTFQETNLGILSTADLATNNSQKGLFCECARNGNQNDWIVR